MNRYQLGRVRLIEQEVGALLQEAQENGRYQGGKWGGLYLRAPEIYYRILERFGDRLVRLGDVADVKRGLTTGANDFFYLRPLPHRPACPLCGVVHEEALTQEEEAAYWERGERPPAERLVAVGNGLGWEGYLEASVLRPLFKTPRKAPTLGLQLAGLERVFMPETGVLKRLPCHAKGYVKYGETVPVPVKRGSARGSTVKGVPALSTVRGRNPWWWLGAWKDAWIILPMLENTRKYTFWNAPLAAVDNALYLVYPKRDVKPWSLFLSLNTTLFHLFKELLARPPEGLGALQIKVYQYEAMPIPHPELFADKAGSFQGLLRVPIPDFWQEVGLTPPAFDGPPRPSREREALDRVVFDAAGFTEEERAEVYRATARLVWQRIAQAKGLNGESEEGDEE